MTRNRGISLLLLGTCVAGALISFAALRPSRGSAEQPFDVRDSFAVFSRPAAKSPPASALASRTLDVADELGGVRILSAGLGRFDSRLMAFPARLGRNVCYSLVGARETDPGMTYCYAPRNPSAPEDVAGDHFSVAGLEDRLIDGKVAVQLFGVAFDDVVKLRVQVGGKWRPIPLRSNGFYVDLLGVSREDLGIVEASLADGSIQTHDLQPSSRRVRSG